MYDVRLVWAFFRTSNSESSECGEDLGGAEVSDISADPDVGAGLRLAPGAVEQGLCRPDAGRVRRRSVTHYGGERRDRLLGEAAGHLLDIRGDFQPAGGVARLPF